MSTTMREILGDDACQLEKDHRAGVNEVMIKRGIPESERPELINRCVYRMFDTEISDEALLEMNKSFDEMRAKAKRIVEELERAGIL